MTPVAALVGCLIAYTAGSIPSAYIAGRVVRGIDLRTVGSGNLGATNVYRELGAVPAIVVPSQQLIVPQQQLLIVR